MYKKILVAEDAQKKISAGVNQVADVVKITLGPFGRNVMLHRKNKDSEITNDGKKIAEAIFLKDETENAAARHIIGAATRTAQIAGDGTTTAIVLTRKLYDDASKRISEGSKLFIKGKKEPVLSVVKEINEWKDRVLTELKKLSKQVKSGADVKCIATTSMENQEVGEIIGDMVYKLGKECVLQIEARNQPGITTEVIKGMQLFCGFGQEYDVEGGKVHLKNVPVLVTNHEITEQGTLSMFLNKYGKETTPEQQKAGIVILAEGFGGEVMKAIRQNEKTFRVVPISGKYLSSYQFKDVALFTKARFIDKNADMELRDVSVKDLGFAGEVIAEKYYTALLHGAGDQEQIDTKIQEIRELLAKADSSVEKERLEKRLAGLAGGFGKVIVGAQTHSERGYLFDKAEDAIRAARCAMEEGVVKGGGLALKEIADKLPKNILTETLKSPYLQIQENAGGEIEIGDEIKDPTKVVRIALESACSAASTLLTTGASIVEQNDEVEVLRKLINHEIELPNMDEYTPEHLKQ